MISDVLSAIKKIKPYFLLTTFITLSLTLAIVDSNILIKPLSAKALIIPLTTLLSYALSWYWTALIFWFSRLLPKDDVINVGVLVACSILTFALAITFSFFGSTSRDQGLLIIANPEFTYTITLYLLAFVAFEVSKR